VSLAGSMASVVQDLQDAGVRFALVGGFAIGVHTEPRFTRDLDFAVAVSSDAEAEQLARTLHGRRYTTFATVEQRRTGRLATLRLWTPGDDFSRVAVDLLFATCGIEPAICALAQRVEVVPGLSVPVAVVGHLVAMKLLSEDSDRARDTQDLTNLRAVATSADIDLAREAVHTIVSLGTHRGKPLVELFEAWVGRASG